MYSRRFKKALEAVSERQSINVMEVLNRHGEARKRDVHSEAFSGRGYMVDHLKLLVSAKLVENSKDEYRNVKPDMYRLSVAGSVMYSLILSATQPYENLLIYRYEELPEIASNTHVLVGKGKKQMKQKFSEFMENLLRKE
jgi:hypothetical protein